MATRREVRVPDLGNFKDVPVLEVLVKPGDTVAAEASLIVLESDKAAMDIPAPFAGKVVEIKVAAGATVSEGDVIAIFEVAEEEKILGKEKAAGARAPAAAPSAASAPAPVSASPGEPVGATHASPAQATAPVRESQQVRESPSAVEGSLASAPPASVSSGPVASNAGAYASPVVRRFARELGVDLSRVRGTARGGRITREDVQAFVKAALAAPVSGVGATSSGFPFSLEIPAIDFSKWGAVERKPMSRIRRVAATHLHRAWVSIPHVTQFDEADITELEAFRSANGDAAKALGFKLTPLAFILKAVSATIDRYPQFASSLAPGGEELVMKGYRHIGVAVDTPEGLVVPVIRDVDQKGVMALAKELGEVSQKARDKKLRADDLQGGVFSISSLGGIGGTAFTPIVNSPEVAILGVARSQTKPLWRDGIFVPRLMLPLALSYDHRVIDGAEGARFITHLSSVLEDIRLLAL